MKIPRCSLPSEEWKVLSALGQLNRAGSSIDIEIETRMIGQNERIEKILESLSTSGFLETHQSPFGKLYVITRRGCQALRDSSDSSATTGSSLPLNPTPFLG